MRRFIGRRLACADPMGGSTRICAATLTLSRYSSDYVSAHSVPVHPPELS